MIKVYVAAPYSYGSQVENVRRAILVSNKLLDMGYAPYCPHLTHFWHLICPRPYEDWLKLDQEFLKCCDVVLRLPGKSEGADKEVLSAVLLGKFVVSSIEELERFSSYWRGRNGKNP